MSNFNKQPNTQFDLSVHYEGDGTTANESLAVRAFVLDPTGTEITGSPFTLTHTSYGVYQLNSAFTVNVIGIWKVIYRVYTTYPTRDYNWREISDLIDVKYEESGGSVVVGGAGKIDENIIKDIAESVWRFDLEKIKNNKTAGRQLMDKEFNVEFPEMPDYSDKIISEIKKLPQIYDLPKYDDKKVVDLLENIINIQDNQINEYNKGIKPVLNGIKDVAMAVNSLKEPLQNIKLSVKGLGVEIFNKLTRYFDIKFSKNYDNFGKISEKIDLLDKNDLETFFNIIDVLISYSFDKDERNVLAKISEIKNSVDSLPRDFNGIYDVINQLNKAETVRLKYIFNKLKKSLNDNTVGDELSNIVNLIKKNEKKADN